jgi:hypothetical protein
LPEQGIAEDNAKPENAANPLFLRVTSVFHRIEPLKLMVGAGEDVLQPAPLLIGVDMWRDLHCSARHDARLRQAMIVAVKSSISHLSILVPGPCQGQAPPLQMPRISGDLLAGNMRAKDL